ncbi:MAG: hypothetical protein ACJAQT_005256 [Akkermansiaceae bacterium]|jgi:hypothetical protein
MAVGSVSYGKVPNPSHVLLEPGYFSANFLGGSMVPCPPGQDVFWAAVFLGHQASCLLAVVEDESPAVSEGDFDGLPGGALVVALGLCADGVPFLVEPVEVRVVIRDPFVALAENGGDEVGGFEDLEVALGSVMAFGAVDDGLAGGVSSNFLQRGVFAKATTPKEEMA